MEGPGAWLASYPQWVDPLLDIGDGRVAAMDAAGIDTAVLSLTAPGVEQLEGPEAVKLARESNDILGNAVREHSGRLAGFATVPVSVPGAAADELERAVREYGFLGAVIRPWPPWPWLRPPTSSRTAPANPATSPHTRNRAHSDILPAVNGRGFLLRGSCRAPAGSCFTGSGRGVPRSYSPSAGV
jgi:hypothetical protein